MTNEQQTNEIKEAIKNVDKFNQQLAKISKRVKNNHHFSTSKFVKSKYFSVKESLEQIENTSTFSYQYGNSDSFK